MHVINVNLRLLKLRPLFAIAAKNDCVIRQCLVIRDRAHCTNYAAISEFRVTTNNGYKC